MAKAVKNRHIVVYVPGHPLAFGRRRAATIGAHRVILYEEIGEGPHKCHWCSVILVWAPPRAVLSEGTHRLIVDHLDGNPINNSPKNLVPACSRCNILRSTPNVGRKRKLYTSRAVGVAVAYEKPLPPPHTVGPLRNVLREVPQKGPLPRGKHYWVYELECGHVVKRRGTGRTKCVCPHCC